MPITDTSALSFLLWGRFSWFGLSPLVSMKGNLNATVCYFRQNALPHFLQNFGEAPILFHHDNVTVPKVRYTKKWFCNLFWRPAQSPDLNFIQWLQNDLEHWARPATENPYSQVPNFCGTPSQTSGCCYSGKFPYNYFPWFWKDMLNNHIWVFYHHKFSCHRINMVTYYSWFQRTEGSSDQDWTQWAKMNQTTQFSCQNETKMTLSNSRGRRQRCEGGRCWDLPKRQLKKTGSQHQLTQLLFSCHTTNTNRQLGLRLAWIQIEDKTCRGTHSHQGNVH